MRLRQSRIAAMTLGFWITAMRCIRGLELFQLNVADNRVVI